MRRRLFAPLSWAWVAFLLAAWLLLIGAVVSVLVRPAAAADCGMALSLGFDISVSVDAEELDFMRAGVVAALTDPEIAALVEGRGGVMMQAFRWDGESHILAPWRLVYGAADLMALAGEVAAIDSSSPSAGYARITGLAQAMEFGVGQLAATGCSTLKLDIAGDGPENSGGNPMAAQELALAAGVQINGLAILSSEDSHSTSLPPGYYETFVKTGPGSFVVHAQAFADFAEAFRLKLLRELSLIVGAL